MERVVFRQDVPTMFSARWGSPDYDGLLKNSLESIAHQLERDLERNERENNYITDNTAKELKLGVGELERCGISTGSASGKIEKLAWFVGGDPAKIRELQSKLNQLGIGGSWVGGALGAKGGAILGASIGTAILLGVGTAIVGIAVGLFLGIAGSFAGDKLGNYVVDITVLE